MKRFDWREETDVKSERLEATVHGVVQGVGFRAFVRRTASDAGLGGFVRNRPDGTVEVVAEGPPETLDALVAALERGPAAGRVERVESRRLDASGGFEGFSIRY
ncbi:MAG: acylphosphatase [Candidatus Eisenbacteria bacterium]|nr:acylphosphatase [Candidatus Eisenbacteria bacterium]